MSKELRAVGLCWYPIN